MFKTTGLYLRFIFGSKKMIAMKFTWIVLVAALAWSCTSSRQVMVVKDKNLTTQAEMEQEEEVEYDVEVFDPQFDIWYEMNWSPANERTERYYKLWNDRYVNAWNWKASQTGYGSFFASTINYDPSEEYGIELNRKLYYYFRYVEMELRIPILDTIRPVGI